MARNGSGNYSLPSGNPVVPSTVISSTWANTTLSDIATALTQSIANDGQTTPVADLPMATFKHTNVGNATMRNQYASAAQVQDSSLHWLTSVAGADTITASIAPGPAAYAAGQTFHFVAAATNTTAVTLNINGLGAKALTKRGTSALSAGDIVSGEVVGVTYDGTQFQLASNSAGALAGVQVFTANGTYTPTPGTKSVIVKAVGGGGGSGGTGATGAATSAVSGAGAAGAYAEARFLTGFSGVTVTIGAAGAGGSVGANNGTAGGDTSFGALISCPGGPAGIGGAPVGTSVTTSPASASSAPTISGASVTLASMPGNSGDTGVIISAPASVIVRGTGGSSVLSPGGFLGNVPSSNYGAGATGQAAGVGTGAQAGFNGGPGVVIVYEYA